MTPPAANAAPVRTAALLRLAAVGSDRCLATTSLAAALSAALPSASTARCCCCACRRSYVGQEGGGGGVNLRLTPWAL